VRVPRGQSSLVLRSRLLLEARANNLLSGMAGSALAAAVGSKVGRHAQWGSAAMRPV
jgi:hypothetical protein